MVLKQDDFTEHAQEILGTSQEIARRYKHSQWDVEHILMALLEQEKGVTAEILAKLGASRAATRPARRASGAGPKGGIRVIPDIRGPKSRQLS